MRMGGGDGGGRLLGSGVRFALGFGLQSTLDVWPDVGGEAEAEDVCLRLLGLELVRVL